MGTLIHNLNDRHAKGMCVFQKDADSLQFDCQSLTNSGGVYCAEHDDYDGEAVCYESVDAFVAGKKLEN